MERDFGPFVGSVEEAIEKIAPIAFSAMQTDTVLIPFFSVKHRAPAVAVVTKDEDKYSKTSNLMVGTGIFETPYGFVVVLGVISPGVFEVVMPMDPRQDLVYLMVRDMAITGKLVTVLALYKDGKVVKYKEGVTGVLMGDLGTVLAALDEARLRGDVDFYKAVEYVIEKYGQQPQQGYN